MLSTTSVSGNSMGNLSYNLNREITKIHSQGKEVVDIMVVCSPDTKGTFSGSYGRVMTSSTYEALIIIKQKN